MYTAITTPMMFPAITTTVMFPAITTPVMFPVITTPVMFPVITTPVMFPAITTSVMFSTSSTSMMFPASTSVMFPAMTMAAAIQDQAPLFRMWKEGGCYMDIWCEHRHYYNDTDAAAVKAGRQVQGPACGTSNHQDNWTSPVCEMVTKEVSKQRKEEIDLESGERKSLIESTEYEVVDLSGKPASSRTRLSKKSLEAKQSQVKKGKEGKKGVISHRRRGGFRGRGRGR